MRILQRGNYHKEKVAKCGVCGCKFAFTKDDIGVDEASQYDGNYAPPCYYLLCPQCKTSVMAICHGSKEELFSEFEDYNG